MGTAPSAAGDVVSEHTIMPHLFWNAFRLADLTALNIPHLYVVSIMLQHAHTTHTYTHTQIEHG